MTRADAAIPDVPPAVADGGMAPGDAATQHAPMTPRGLYVVLALLTIVLVALLIYAIWFLGRPEQLTQLPARGRLQPVWLVHGPARGTSPAFDRPMGVAVGISNRIYVTDSGNNRVCVFDASGRYLFEFGGFGIAKPAAGVSATYDAGELNFPVGIDTDEDGNVYVASLRNDSIEVYDPYGEPTRRFPDPSAVTGKGGSGQEGLGIAVTDVAVHENRVYATDSYQILVFSLTGQLVDQWGMPGSEPTGLDHPNGIAVADDGTVYVSDSNHQRVTAFTPDGDVLWHVGEIGEDSPDDREVDLPRGLTVMPDGSILVVDSFAFELIRISSDGQRVDSYGERGIEPAQVNFPNDVETLNDLLVVADKENGRVQVVRIVD